MTRIALVFLALTPALWAQDRSTPRAAFEGFRKAHVAMEKQYQEAWEEFLRVAHSFPPKAHELCTPKLAKRYEAGEQKSKAAAANPEYRVIDQGLSFVSEEAGAEGVTIHARRVKIEERRKSHGVERTEEVREARLLFTEGSDGWRVSRWEQKCSACLVYGREVPRPKCSGCTGTGWERIDAFKKAYRYTRAKPRKVREVTETSTPRQLLTRLEFLRIEYERETDELMNGLGPAYIEFVKVWFTAERLKVLKASMDEARASRRAFLASRTWRFVSSEESGDVVIATTEWGKTEGGRRTTGTNFYELAKSEGNLKIARMGKPCRNCKGTGECPRCKGSGDETKSCYGCKRRARKKEPPNQACERCKGTGEYANACTICTQKKGVCKLCGGERIKWWGPGGS